jgi:hypothetical protein
MGGPGCSASACVSPYGAASARRTWVEPLHQITSSSITAHPFSRS